MPDIGSTLQEARMRARIDVSEVEAATKIRAKYLRAIENEEWDLLPGPTFVKSFIRTYAEFLGLDGRMLVDEYKQRYEAPGEVELHPIGPPSGRDRAGPPRPSRGWAIGLAVLGVVALLVLLGSLGGDEPEPEPAATTATAPPPRAAPAAPARRPRPRAVTVSFAPREPVYVCLRNAAGDLLVNSTLEPGRRQPTYRSRSFRVTVGRSEIAMRVNGRRLGVPPSAEPTTYELTTAGRRKLSTDQSAC